MPRSSFASIITSLDPPATWNMEVIFCGLTRESSARGEFPFRLGWQALPGPPSIREGILVGDVNHWVVILAFEITVRDERMPPVCSAHVIPPIEMVIE